MIGEESNDNKVSVIITILNGDKWINKCFHSILNQRLSPLNLEVAIFDDCSTDKTAKMLIEWRNAFEKQGICLSITKNNGNLPKGVGFGRNRAIESSSGAYLCFQDIDDEMLPGRIENQYMLAKCHQNAIIGSRFKRLPKFSTCRFSNWANELPSERLSIQIFTANGPTIIMPTWFCHRRVYERVKGGFCEAGRGTPEDLIFFYKHLELGGEILRSDDILLLYRYHSKATTFTIKSDTIWYLRLEYLLGHVLSKEPWCNGFSIWNAGKQGRRFFRDLPNELKDKVQAFCDIDQNKIGKNYQYYDSKTHRFTHSLPVVHFSEVQPPIIICMKLNLTNGEFENNLDSLNLREGVDYILFT